jgi:class 3 adenylate cyclase
MNLSIDVRDVLASINVPTLVVHATGDETVDVRSGRYLAEHIAGARLVELSQEGHVSFEGRPEWMDPYQELVTGELAPVPTDRVLATVLFTDIVRSTELAAEHGDARWRQLLDGHDEVVRRQVQAHRGVYVKSTGDGCLARFDGPGRAVACAQAIGADLAPLGLASRAGAHTGEVELRGDDIGGIAVHIASRVAGQADDGEVWVSRTVKDLTVGSALGFEPRGEHQLKGVPDTWQLFAAVA